MKKIFAVLFTVAIFATNAVIVMANDYEDAYDEYAYDYEYEYAYDEPEYDLTLFPEIDFDWWFPPREFESLIEELVFHRFGEGSEFLLPYVTEINRSFTVGRFEIEVIGAIAFENRERTHRMLHFYDDVEYEETADFTMEMVYVTTVESNVFVAVRDLRSELDTQIEAQLELAHVFDEFGWLTPDGGWSHTIHVWRETDRFYFAINQRHNFFEDEPGQVDFSFTLEYLLTDFVWSVDSVGIDIAALLQNHEASFETETEEYYYIDDERFYVSRWGWASPAGSGFFGDVFDPMSADFEVLAAGELNIHLGEGHYLTNIALTHDEVLRVQLTIPSHRAVRTGMGWTSVSLTNVAIEAERNALWEEWDRRWIEWIEQGNDWEAFDESWLWDRLDEISGRDLQELFQISTSRWWDVDAPEVIETGYFIYDLDMLNHLDFMVHTSYYETHLPIPFSFSGVVPVQAFSAVEFPGTHRVFVHDRYLNFVNVSVGLTGIGFDVQHTAFLMDIDRDLGISAHDLFEFEIIMADGDVLTDLWFGGSTWWWPIEGDELYVSSFIFNYFTDVRQVVGVRINGTEIRLQ